MATTVLQEPDPESESTCSSPVLPSALVSVERVEVMPSVENAAVVDPSDVVSTVDVSVVVRAAVVSEASPDVPPC